jgi:hypothetical protein
MVGEMLRFDHFAIVDRSAAWSTIPIQKHAQLTLRKECDFYPVTGGFISSHLLAAPSVLCQLFYVCLESSSSRISLVSSFPVPC